MIGISIINHPFWGTTIFGNTHIGLSNFVCAIFPEKIAMRYISIIFSHQKMTVVIF